MFLYEAVGWNIYISAAVILAITAVYTVLGKSSRTPAFIILSYTLCHSYFTRASRSLALSRTSLVHRSYSIRISLVQHSYITRTSLVPHLYLTRTSLGIRNGHKNFQLLAKFCLCSICSQKFRLVLACSCSQTFCNCSHARILVKICSIS